MIDMRSAVRNISILFFLISVFSTVLAQDLSITKARITTGAGSLSLLPAGSGAHLCFELENTADQDQYLIVSLRSEAAKGENEYFSAEFFAPAKSVQQCRFLFQYDGSRSYTVSAGGMAKIADSEIYVLPWEKNDQLHLTVTDELYFSGVSSITDYCNLAGFPNRCAVERISGDKLPVTVLQLEPYRVILLYKTDFTRWYAKSFEAVAEYVRNGGTLCFGTPQDAKNALQTPLAELVPMTKNGMWLEKKTGRGIVRASEFDIWQKAGEISGNGYGKELGNFLAGMPIAARPVVYTHTRLEHNSTGWNLSIPSGRRLIAVLIVLFGGIFAVCLVENLLRLVLGGKIKKWYSYVIVVLWSIIVLLTGCINGGQLFDRLPLPGGDSEVNLNTGTDK